MSRALVTRPPKSLKRPFSDEDPLLVDEAGSLWSRPTGSGSIFSTVARRPLASLMAASADDDATAAGWALVAAEQVRLYVCFRGSPVASGELRGNGNLWGYALL